MQRALPLLALLLTLPLAAYAFDGRREGFLFGLGFGPGYQSIKQEWLIGGELSQHKDSDSTFGTALQFGYGLTDHLVLGWVMDLGSDTDDETKLLGTEVKKGNTRFEIDGFSATYFFKKRAPSPFVEAIIGTARWDDGGNNVLDGLGLAGSIGLRGAQALDGQRHHRLGHTKRRGHHRRPSSQSRGHGLGHRLQRQLSLVLNARRTERRSPAMPFYMVASQSQDLNHTRSLTSPDWRLVRRVTIDPVTPCRYMLRGGYQRRSECLVVAFIL